MRLSRPARLTILVAVLVLGALAAIARPLVATVARERVVSLLQRKFAHVEVAPDAQLGWLGRLSLGPVLLRNAPNAPPVVAIARLEAEVDVGSCLRGPCRPRRLTLVGGRVEAGEDGEALRALLSRHPSAPRADTAGQTRAPALTLEDWQFTATHAGRSWSSGRVDGTIRMAATARGREASVSLVGEALGFMKVQVEPGAPVRWWIEEAPLAPVAAFLGDSLRVEQGTLSGEVQLDPEARTARLDLRVGALTISGDERLSHDPIGPLQLGLAGTVRAEAGFASVSTEDLALRLGNDARVAAGVRASFKAGSDPLLRLAVSLDRVPFAALVAALPAALSPGAPADGVDGPLSASVSLVAPLRRRDAWELVPKLDLAALRKQARAHPSPLRTTFTHHPLLADGSRGRAIVVGPETPDFVPLTEVPPLLVRAVLLSEDAGFFGHAGFEFTALTEHLLDPKEDGEVVRGGSSLTQQLAKNLFYSRERTYARKVREALGTVALEAALPKERLLEIYLNVIEWGPELYGLAEAAHHYFDVDPRRLSPKQAAFLAAIIPNPVRYHASCSKGALTEALAPQVEALLTKLRDTGALTPDEWDAAMSETLVFPRHAAADEAAP